MPGDGDWTKTFAPGDPWRPRADWLNNVTRATVAQLRSQGGNSISPPPESFPPEGLILIKNGTGSDVARFAILGLNGVVIEPHDNLPDFLAGPVFFGDLPNAGDTFVVCAEPIAKDKFGHAYIFGVCPCKVDIVSTSDGFADLIDGDKNKLRSGSSGPVKILWSESGTGTKWAVILFAGASDDVDGVVSANAAGFGQYDVKSLTGTCTTTPATNLTMPPPGMTIAATSDILFLNPDESGLGTHNLSVGTPVSGKVVGMTTETVPRRIVWGFPKGGGVTLPDSTDQFQVLQRTTPAGTPAVYAFDWTRGHS